MTFLQWVHDYIPLSIFDHADFLCHAVAGRLVEEGVLFKSQYRLYAVDCGRVVVPLLWALDGAC